MELARTFAQLGKDDASIAGGKGASLGELTKAGIPVPSGFVVLSSAFELFLQESDLIQEIDAILIKVNPKEMSSVEHASEKIQALILQAPMPQVISDEIDSQYKKLDTQFVAVRSSATAEDSASAAWAGQLDSFLNTTQTELLKNIQRCWASLFTPRAVFYRFEKELHLTKISVAVVVQKMVESEYSGVAFSVHPVTEDRNQLIIEAGFGLGEAIVSGQITPDSYVVEKEPRNIVDINRSTQRRGLYRSAGSGNEWRDIEDSQASSQVLTAQQILELSDLIIKIEKHYEFPCDIEWAFERGAFYIVQSRPITTLSEKIISPITLTKYMTREHSMFYAHVWEAANRNHWNRYFLAKNIKNMVFLLDSENILEIYYDLQELESTLKEAGDGVVKETKIVDQIIADFYHHWNVLSPYVIDHKKIESIEELKNFYHTWIEWWVAMEHVFIIPEQMQIPEEIRQKVLKVREETQEYSDDGDKIVIDFFSRAYPQYANLAHVLTPEEMFQIETLTSEEVENIKNRVGQCALATINGKPILLQGSNIRGQLAERGIQLAVIESHTKEKIEFKKSYSRDTTLFMQGLWAKGLTQLPKEKFGWDNPHLPFIAHYVNDGVVEIWEHKEAIQWFLDRLHKEITTNPNFLPELLVEYKNLQGQLKQLHNKEFISTPADLELYNGLIYKTAFVMTIFFYTGMDERNPAESHEIAVQARTEGDFFAENDVFVRKNIAKLGNFSDELAGVVLPEEFEHVPAVEILSKRLNSFLMIDGKNPYLGTLEAFANANSQYVFEGIQAGAQEGEIRGQTAFAGVVRGVVRIVKKQSHMQKVQEGDILVSPMTTPDFLPAMKIAGAFVTDEGGVTCHAAIVAREMKKPCIIGTKFATQVLNDGDLVEVHATDGTVKILQKA